jgi:hypothetical protein
MKDQLVSADS